MNKVFIPVSIVISGLIVAGAIYLTTYQQKKQNEPAPDVQLSISPIDATDHIIGNPNADIVIVEYSDLQCPYCKAFHATMRRIIEEYGTSGKVAWVYRHFPLTSIHERAMPAAYASECAAKIGGNDKFWEYINLLSENSPESLSDENLLTYATKIGIPESEFKACLASDYPKQEVEKDIKDGNEIIKVDKKFGTPYNILISKSGVQVPLKGNQPYTTVKGTIDAILGGQKTQ